MPVEIKESDEAESDKVVLRFDKLKQKANKLKAINTNNKNNYINP